MWGSDASRGASTSRGGGARAAPSAAGVAPAARLPVGPPGRPLTALRPPPRAQSWGPARLPGLPAQRRRRGGTMSGPARPCRRPAPRPRPRTHGAVAAPGMAPAGGPAPEAAVPSERGCRRRPAPRAREGAQRRGEGTTQAAMAAEPGAGPCADPTPSRSVPRGPAPAPAPRRGRVITSRRGGGGLGGVSHVIRSAEPGAAGRGDAQEERS